MDIYKYLGPVLTAKSLTKTCMKRHSDIKINVLYILITPSGLCGLEEQMLGVKE